MSRKTMFFFCSVFQLNENRILFFTERSEQRKSGILAADSGAVFAAEVIDSSG